MTKIKELHLDSGSDREHGWKKQVLTGGKNYFKKDTTSHEEE